MFVYPIYLSAEKHMSQIVGIVLSLFVGKESNVLLHFSYHNKFLWLLPELLAIHCKLFVIEWSLPIPILSAKKKNTATMPLTRTSVFHTPLIAPIAYFGHFLLSMAASTSILLKYRCLAFR